MSRSRRACAVVSVCLGTFMATLAISIISVALPAIQTGLHTGLAGLQWVIGSLTLCLSAFMLSAGAIGDRYGRKRTWLAGVVLFMIGTIVSAGAPSLAVLIAGCALQGIAGALVIPGALSILTQAYADPHQRAHVIGGWASFSAVSLILGPLLGGFLVDTMGWPSIFLANVPIGLVTIALGVSGIAESADPAHAAFDPAGQLLSIVFLGALAYALIDAGHAGWTAPPVLAALGIAAVSLVVFMAVELRAARPVLPVDLFRPGQSLPGSYGFASVNLASFVLGFSGYSSIFLFSLFLQQAQGRSAAQTGLRMTPVFIAMMLASSVSGRLSRRHGAWPMILGYALIGASMLGMAAFSASTPYAAIAPLFALLGTGLGLAVPATSAAAMMAAPRERSGAASATVNALRQAGMTIGIALLGTVMGTRAVSSLSGALSGAGIARGPEWAGLAVSRHELPAGLGMARALFGSLLARAFADGFSAAAACAGTLGLAVAAILWAAIAAAGPARRAARRRPG